MPHWQFSLCLSCECCWIHFSNQANVSNQACGSLPCWHFGFQCSDRYELDTRFGEMISITLADDSIRQWYHNLGRKRNKSGKEGKGSVKLYILARNQILNLNNVTAYISSHFVTEGSNASSTTLSDPCALSVDTRTQEKFFINVFFFYWNDYFKSTKNTHLPSCKPLAVSSSKISLLCLT